MEECAACVVESFSVSCVAEWLAGEAAFDEVDGFFEVGEVCGGDVGGCGVPGGSVGVEGCGGGFVEFVALVDGVSGFFESEC